MAFRRDDRMRLPRKAKALLAMTGVLSRGLQGRGDLALDCHVAIAPRNDEMDGVYAPRNDVALLFLVQLWNYKKTSIRESDRGLKRGII